MNDSQSGTQAMIWVVGIISIAALALAWVAYNRSGENLTTNLQQEADELALETEQAANEFGSAVAATTNNALNSIDETLARTEARAEILATQAELEAEENYESALASVQSVRADLRQTYNQAEGQAVARFEELDRELDQLEQSIRSESADALEVMAGLVLMLEADVRTDEE